MAQPYVHAFAAHLGRDLGQANKKQRRAWSWGRLGAGPEINRNLKGKISNATHRLGTYFMTFFCFCYLYILLHFFHSRIERVSEPRASYKTTTSAT